MPEGWRPLFMSRSSMRTCPRHVYNMFESISRCTPSRQDDPFQRPSLPQATRGGLRRTYCSPPGLRWSKSLAFQDSDHDGSSAIPGQVAKEEPAGRLDQRNRAVIQRNTCRRFNFLPHFMQ